MRGLVGDDGHVLAGMGAHDVAHDGQRAREHAHPRLAPLGREREGVRLPGLVLPGEPFFDLATGQPFPPPVADLAQAVALDGDEAVRPTHDLRGLARAAQRAAVERDDAVVAEARGQALGLGSPFVGEVDADRAREAILCRELGRAVADQEESRRHEGCARILK